MFLIQQFWTGKQQELLQTILSVLEFLILESSRKGFEIEV